MRAIACLSSCRCRPSPRAELLVHFPRQLAHAAAEIDDVHVRLRPNQRQQNRKTAVKR